MTRFRNKSILGISHAFNYNRNRLKKPNKSYFDTTVDRTQKKSSKTKSQKVSLLKLKKIQNLIKAKEEEKQFYRLIATAATLLLTIPIFFFGKHLIELLFKMK